jgi:hypothetical protein
MHLTARPARHVNWRARRTCEREGTSRDSNANVYPFGPLLHTSLIQSGNESSVRRDVNFHLELLALPGRFPACCTAQFLSVVLSYGRARAPTDFRELPSATLGGAAREGR